MVRQIILLSGPISAGKSTLAQSLVDRYGLIRIRTQQLIRSATPNLVEERSALQRAGDALDRKTGGAWVGRELVRLAEGLDDAIVVVDSVRIPKQIGSIREAFGARVVHVHLTAPVSVLGERYGARRSAFRELPTYEAVRANKTERDVERLAKIADVVIDTVRCTAEDVVVRVASHLGFFGRSYRRLVDVFVGGAYGSEGKGHVVSYVAREYDVLVRVGGPNAGHTVYEEPKPYTFHHLPSGTRCSEAALILGPGAVIRVPTLLREIADCQVTHDRLAVDPQAMVISDEDVQFEGKTLKRAIGSTAQGVGAATARRVMRGAQGAVSLAKDVGELRPFVRETRQVLDDAFYQGRKILLEGTQGTGLSLFHGQYPHVTSRDTTVSGCLAEAGIAPSRVRKIIMVCRTYPIRVESPREASSGPMSNELTWDEIAQRSGIRVEELLEAERTSTTHRKRRVGEFDWTLIRKAASLNGPTDIALTFADYVDIQNRNARRFDQLTEPTIRLIEEIERVTAAPVSLITTRFHSRSIIDRRAW